MSWRCFHLTFCQLSDICIGVHKLGWVQRTRYFIPARNLWAAATAAKARRGPTLDYASSDVDQDLRFTPLFLWDGSGWKFPWPGVEKFECEHVSSRGRATIDPGSATAADGGLLDMEFLARMPGCQGHKWSGYVWALGDNSEVSLRSWLARIEVGGERRYGMGVLRLETCEEEKGNLYGELCWKGEGDQPRVAVRKGVPVPAHVALERQPEGLHACGEIEPLTGRATTRADGFGQEAVAMRLCWMPGARLDSNCPLEVGRQGVWTFPESIDLGSAGGKIGADDGAGRSNCGLGPAASAGWTR